RLAKLSVGPGLDDGTDLGPLVNEDTRSKVAGLVDETTAGGARVVTGGRAPERRGYFYQPTVLDDAPADAGILDEEIFGPVAPIVRFTDADEAVALANGTEYGLVSYLYTRDLRRALQVAEALEAGMVGINRGVVSDPAAPFGGVKQSGLGREGAHHGLLEFTETKYIAVGWEPGLTWTDGSSDSRTSTASPARSAGSDGCRRTRWPGTCSGGSCRGDAAATSSCATAPGSTWTWAAIPSTRPRSATTSSTWWCTTRPASGSWRACSWTPTGGGPKRASPAISTCSRTTPTPRATPTAATRTTWSAGTGSSAGWPTS